MNWEFLDHNFWQTLVTLLTLGIAIWIAKVQNKISSSIFRTQDAIELYASSALRKNQNSDGKTMSETPLIYIQNVGTRLIYLDQYNFNGRLYKTDGQILPSTYSQALNNFYWIELPINGENHVSLEVFYHDQEKRYWSSLIIADFKNGFWNIKTLPRKSVGEELVT